MSLDIVVYDAGDSSPERYTVFPYTNSRNHDERSIYLGMSEGGVGVSMWGELPANCPRGPHLGKLVQFSELSEDTQKHIIRRLAE
jgi:hypothetical protein